MFNAEQVGLTPEEVISKIMENPDVAMAFQNPKVQAAILDVCSDAFHFFKMSMYTPFLNIFFFIQQCSQNPLSIAKYQNDKEVSYRCCSFGNMLSEFSIVVKRFFCSVPMVNLFCRWKHYFYLVS